ncbi:hypothetical protein RFI_21864 [Reticulomyxa filosa]|uniref:Uncharacterized protein n=1 Tax=Reticulomyxa filosa TaxID=46433 RepID=X6MNS8_RETFI|nr:hypothetical protein RFI_21864 [Reticulomyxa filosa]|eukprot:ETO15499.1 hypothetical protein RFI_21864 [Reticulomyxa filosa]
MFAFFHSQHETQRFSSRRETAKNTCCTAFTNYILKKQTFFRTTKKKVHFGLSLKKKLLSQKKKLKKCIIIILFRKCQKKKYFSFLKLNKISFFLEYVRLNNKLNCKTFFGTFPHIYKKVMSYITCPICTELVPLKVINIHLDLACDKKKL